MAEISLWTTDYYSPWGSKNHASIVKMKSMQNNFGEHGLWFLGFCPFSCDFKTVKISLQTMNHSLESAQKFYASRG